MNAQEWLEHRLPSTVVHLDVAGCGRVSQQVLDDEVAHLHREAEVGGYVAQQESAAHVDAGRHALAAMVGLSGSGLAFVDGAATAFATLLAAWPLPRGARIGTAGSEYGANARCLARLAAECGWRLVPLPADDLGRITGVPDGLDLATFPQVASQRGTAQPVEEVFATGTPLLLDVAQALGQVPVLPGCAAYVGTSRKWLCGPRGVGFLVVDPAVQQALREPPTLMPTMAERMQRWESGEAHVAGRVGLATAAREWSDELVPRALAAAAYAWQVLDGVAGWTVREHPGEPTGITTLVGGDPVATRCALLERGFVTSAVPTARSADLDRPVLRVSTAAWVEPADLDALAAALPGCTS